MTIYLILLVAVLNQISFGGTRVAMSLYALELGASPFMVGALIALFALCPLLLSITIGKFVDRSSARVPMVLASTVHVVALLLPSVFSGLPVLFVMALMLGFSHSLFLLPLEATAGGIGGPEQRVRNYSLLTMGWAVANFFGPVVAGLSIDYLGHRPVFLVLMAIALVPTLMLYFMPRLIPKAARHATKESHGSVLELWRMPPVRATLIASAIIGSAMDVFQFYFPIYGHSIALSASAIGSIIGMVSVAAFVIRGIVPFLMRKMSEPRILTSAALIAAFAFALLPFFANPYALGAIAFVLGLGVGCANPMTMSLLYVLTPPARIAEALGLNKTFRNGTHFLVPLLFGSVGGTFGFMTVFLSNALMLAAGSALVHKTGVPVGRRPS
jgi:predicted MFS family arabinose efflux permease